MSERTRFCFNSIWILFAVIPVIIFLTLFFMEPGFIQKKDGNKYVLDKSKLLTFWAAFTAGFWLLIILYAFSRGYTSNTDICL